MDHLAIGFPGSIEQTISDTTAMDHTHGWQSEPTDPRLLFIRGFALPSVGSFKSGTRGCLQADASSVALQPAGLTPRSNQTDDRRMTFTARRSSSACQRAVGHRLGRAGTRTHNRWLKDAPMAWWLFAANVPIHSRSTRTGQCASRATRSAVEPISRRFTPVRPCDGKTIKPNAWCSAYSVIPWAASLTAVSKFNP
ncbi:hypothetical protein Enr13x_01880 [Stieleria neptunia]|uniref:Uncharacterized protein n=1 Tax=Stieleria neptunia TaxID=2527979 RepID=A0A518HHS5_9BACT|nr:hypothetical protein Enr13x_01880 [Stieleria neptunia]